MSKISATLIVRDEAATLERLLKQLRPHVTELCIVDTGSTDETPAIARKYADRFQVCLDFNNPETGLIEDFAGARNRALSLASHEWIFWADGDDEIQNAHLLPRLIENQTADNVRIFLPYEYAHDTAGRCICLQWRERLMRPAQWFEWVSPLHEVCLPRPDAPGTHDESKTDLVRLIHRRGESKKPPEPLRNLRILKAHVKRVGEGDVRALYYLGVEYAHTGDMGNAIRYLKRYEQLSGWDDERLMALLEIARMYRTIGDYDTAIQWGLQAMITRAWPEPFWELAKSFYALAQQGVRRDYNLARAASFIQLGLNMQNDTLLFINPMERYAIHEILNVCLNASGNLEGALESCEEGLRGMPESEPLKLNRGLYIKELRRRRVVGGIKEMLTAGDITPKQEVVLRLTLEGGLQVESVSTGESAPSLPAPAPVVEERQAADGRLDIVFFVGHGLEPWNGDTIQKTGMGGSETMAWELARRLARMGHRVRLYGHCTPTMEGLFDGVEFYDQGRYRNLECDVLVASRRPDAVDDSYAVKATARLLWIHDVHVGEGLNFTRAYRFDAILALSEWHKRTLLNVYPSVSEAKIVVTRNGIDLTRFENTFGHWEDDDFIPGERDPHKCVFSSSPDRGLQPLLDMWPRIREQVPDATLHVFYGWDNWEKVARMNGDRAQLAAIANLKHLASTLPGVTLRGRVSQEELAREFLSAGVLTYPTHFWETSCCHPDTRIAVPGDHRGGAPWVRIADLVGKSGFPVYAFNEAENRFELATCKRVWETKVATEIVHLELDSGDTLRLTPEHPVLTFDGDWVEAGTLEPGASLRALHYRYNVAIRDANGRWKDEHRLVGEWKAGRRLGRDEHVDHADPERLDNSPDMLTVMTAAEHFSKTHKGKRLSRKHVAKKAELMRATLAKLPLAEKQARGRSAGALAWAKINSLPTEEREAFFARRATIRMERMAERKALPLAFEGREGRNHKVVRVWRTHEPTPVYDMEVEGLHNFVADGVVVHNCITAMEAQAAGLHIVTSHLAALVETVGDRGVLLRADNPDEVNSERYQKAFVGHVVACMESSTNRESLQQYARDHFSLDALAKDWSQMLTEMVTRLRDDVIGKFQEVAQ